MNILAFGASSSRNSINKKLAVFAAHQVPKGKVTILDLNDFEMPIFSVDKQREKGIHPLAIQFKQEILNADGIIISFAEHNGAYSAAFKNIMDWISRIDSNVWGNKPMLLMATSPGKRGGATVLDIALNKFKFMNKNELNSFSLPFFKENFSESDGIINPELKKEFQEKILAFTQSLISETADQD